ncbi:hypothetical protein STEG23_033407, partial [Scotinomys teguina]
CPEDPDLQARTKCTLPPELSPQPCSNQRKDLRRDVSTNQSVMTRKLIVRTGALRNPAQGWREYCSVYGRSGNSFQINSSRKKLSQGDRGSPMGCLSPISPHYQVPHIHMHSDDTEDLHQNAKLFSFILGPETDGTFCHQRHHLYILSGNRKLKAMNRCKPPQRGSLWYGDEGADICGTSFWTSYDFVIDAA